MTASIRTWSLACLGWALVLLPPGSANAGDKRLTVRGSAKSGTETLVVAEIKGETPPGVYVLKRDDNGPSTPAEVFQKEGKTFIAFALDRAEGDSTTSFTLSKPGSPEPSKSIASDKLEAGDVPIEVGGKPFVTYISKDGPKPYYFPVIGPTGASYSRAFPMKEVAGEDADHPHQRSLWFTHGLVNGFDFWASDPKNKPSPKFGSIKETSRTIVHNGHRAAVIRTTDDWLGNAGEKVCTDERTVGFFGLGKDRVIDFDITLTASSGPVTFGQTKEGMFGIRVASSMDVKNKKNSGGKITNAEGLTDEATWGKASPWVDYVGPLEGKTAGVAILNHPDSFRYPTTWHVRPYGLFAANPFGGKDFGPKVAGEYVIPAGESIRFRYRMILHAGDTDSANVPAAFQVYAEPPRVQVEDK